jgi:hypothetical protein
MSFVIPTHRKSRMLVGAAALLGILVVAILALQRSGTLPTTASSVDDRAPIEVVDQATEQAPWRVRVFPAGTGGKPGAAQMKAIKGQRDDLEGTVTAVYDALLLQPAAIKSMSGKELTPDVAAALERSKLSPSSEVEELRTTKRRARIGIQAKGARHAAARLDVTARALVDGEDVRFRQQITMWLERAGRGWKVVAFEGSQRQLR